MNIYFTEVFRLVHHFTCIYTSSWISHTSDSHKSFNIDIYISFILPAVRASFVHGLYFWFRVFKVIIPVYQYITKFFLRFSTLATGTLRSWSARHQFDACASRWCSTDANPSVPMVRAISTFSFVLKEVVSQVVSHHSINWVEYWRDHRLVDHQPTGDQQVRHNMMPSSNGNIFRVTGPLCGECTGCQWISLTKTSDPELWCFLWSTPE